jgi:hypothetical protein
LAELKAKIQSSNNPLIVGGDFNMIRRVTDKSSGHVDVRYIDAFNEMIDVTELRELQSGSRYIWSNKRIMPVQSVLDRVFVNNAWENKFCLVTVYAPTRIDSDHNPLVVDTRERQVTTPKYFRYDPSWSAQEGFKQWVLDRWPIRFKHNCLDHWHIVSGKLKRAIKGWGLNNVSALKRQKQNILLEIQSLDRDTELRSEQCGVEA